MSASEQALLSAMAGRVSQTSAPVSHWNALRDVPLRLSVDIPLPPMSLRALGALTPGQVLCSSVSTSEDLTVMVGGAPVCQARFEYMDGRMAMRMTRLAGASRTGA